MRLPVLLLLLFMIGCGGSYNADVSGTVTVKHQLDLQDLTVYFAAECLQANPTYTQDQVNTCANSKVGDFLTFVYGGHP